MVVAGAGPAGSIAAKYAALNGANVLLIEEHAAIGSPVECTGLLGTRAISECDLDPCNDFILNEISGTFVYSPSGQCFDIDGKSAKAYVVSRKALDKKLFSDAIDAGVDVSLRTKLVNIIWCNDHQELIVLHNGIKKKIKTRMVIGADGIKSKVAKIAGLGNVKEIISGIQIETPYRSKNSNFVEVFPGSVAPGFFAWTVPVNQNISRIGLGVNGIESPNALEYLRSFLNSNPNVIGRHGDSLLDVAIGGIPLGPLKRTVSDGVLVVGDAAGQVKPTSGGGIYPGAICAKIAGKVAADSVSDEDTSSDYLCQYEQKWRKKIGPELEMGMKLHELAEKFSDDDWNNLLRSMDNVHMKKMISQYGDIDKPSILVKEMLTLRNSFHLMGPLKSVIRAVL
ncbi:geranylgeranyl reductase [Methanosalsum zhilinae DSM 4017]|uniref:Geranylgeranyl reductase n=2 Tax=Methanosalsum zhilinae TaxID=39669 RepID=F7XQ23_METZD|nr:geranylgeranyl reductase [Methanosalsum zhilinae DSM 4017]